MASVSIKAGGAALSSAACKELTAVKLGDELLWSEGTGRSASSGKMAGSVVAGKKTVTLEFGPLTKAAYDAVKSRFGGGFYEVACSVGDTELFSGTFYRGTIPGELLGCIGGTLYYGGVQVELVEQ